MSITPRNEATISFLPVGNGDTSLIALADRTTVLFDLCYRARCDGVYDVHRHLLEEMRQSPSGASILDVFVLSHGDLDHCRGAETVLHLAAPEDHGDKDRKEGKILIGEMWVPARLFDRRDDELCGDAKAIRKEARRRLKLSKDGDAGRHTEGNRIRVVGHSDSADLVDVDDAVFAIPGTTHSRFNGVDRTDFAVFIHAPFKADTDGVINGRNETSIVVQARFEVQGNARAGLVVLGGDADSPIWERIYDISDDATLEWHLLLAPHHCSWTFFSEGPADDTEASEKVLAFLDKRRPGAKVVASCKPIRDDDDNPPHHVAAEHYRERVGVDGLIVTGEHVSEKQPEPVFFRMTKAGPQKATYDVTAVLSAASMVGAASAPRTYGGR